MGQSISSLVDSLQNDAEKEKLANDSLQSLIELAKVQVEAFELCVISDAINAKLIPIDQIIKKDYIIQAMMTNEPTDVGAIIKQCFSEFASGATGDGIGTLVQAGLKLLLGTYSGSQSTRRTYAISCGELGGLSRIDMHFFAYKYTSAQLTQICKQVVSVSVVLSSVDSDKVSDSSLKVIVETMYSDSTKEQRAAILEELLTAKHGSKPSPSSGQLENALVRGCRAVRAGANGGLQVVPGQTTQTEVFQIYCGAMGQERNASPLFQQYLSGYIMAENQRHGGSWFLYQSMWVVCNVVPDSPGYINGYVTITMEEDAFHQTLQGYLRDEIAKALLSVQQLGPVGMRIEHYHVGNQDMEPA